LEQKNCVHTHPSDGAMMTCHHWTGHLADSCQYPVGERGHAVEQDAGCHSNSSVNCWQQLLPPPRQQLLPPPRQQHWHLVHIPVTLVIVVADASETNWTSLAWSFSDDFVAVYLAAVMGATCGESRHAH